MRDGYIKIWTVVNLTNKSAMSYDKEGKGKQALENLKKYYEENGIKTELILVENSVFIGDYQNNA